MSGYRDDREAAVARIETLEAKVREREAGLDARDAEISELRAEIERLRSGISTPERRAAPRWPLLAVVAAGVMIAGVLGAMVTLRTTVPSPARATSEPPPAPAPPPPAPAPPPPAAPAPTPVTTTSPPAWAMVRSGTVKVKACFDHELTKRPNLTGRVDVTLTATGGTVTHVELAPSPVRSAPFDACVTTAFLGLTVPVSEGPTTINVPFNFTAQ
jgi:hypothetical protein